MKKSLFGAIAISLLLFASITLADIPRKINVQGMLSDPVSGKPYSESSVDLTFAFYDQFNNLEDTRQINNVLLDDGFFNIEMSPSLEFDEPYYINVSVWNDTLGWVYLSPLVNMTSVAYSYSASRLLPTTYPISVDLTSYSGGAGRDAVEIFASADNTRGTIVVNKDALQIWSTTLNDDADLWTSDTYAERFIDIDDSSYYCDPDSVSRVRDLNVTESIYVSDISSPGGEITLHGMPTSSSALWFDDGGPTGGFRYYYNSDDLVMYTNGWAAISINGSQQVGIGTLTPDYKLDVNGDVNANQLCIQGVCQSSWPTGDGVSDVWVNETGDTMTGDLTIDKSAATINLGSGADGGPHGIVFADDSGTNQLQLVYRSSPNQLIIEHADTADDIFWIDDDNDYAYFANRLGIGTTSPSVDLDVRNNTATPSRIMANTLVLRGFTNPAYPVPGDTAAWIDHNGGHLYINRFAGPAGNQGIHFVNPFGSTRMSIMEDGNVGIGTTNPQGLLHVADIYSAGGKNLVIGDDVFLTDIDSANTLGIYGLQDTDRTHLQLRGGPLITGMFGNLGIDQQFPAGKIDVAGSGYFHASDGDGTVYLATADDGIQASGSSYGAYIWDRNDLTETWISQGSYSVWGDGLKSFVIDHPTKPGMKLVHATLEGPEAGVFYRGEGQLVNGWREIHLPKYFEALTRKENRTVLLTPIFEDNEPISMLAASSVVDGKFTVRAINNNNPNQKFYWEVKAVRGDIEPLDAEQPEENFPKN